MRCIIAGGRNLTDYDVLTRAVASCPWTQQITIVVSGGARGADKLGERWGIESGLKVVRFSAEWDKYGKQAGMIRNEKMAKYADALIALPGGRGTAHMIRLAIEYGLMLHRYGSAIYVAK